MSWLHYRGIGSDKRWKTRTKLFAPQPKFEYVPAEQNSEVLSLEPVCSVCVYRNRLPNKQHKFLKFLTDLHIAGIKVSALKSQNEL